MAQAQRQIDVAEAGWRAVAEDPRLDAIAEACVREHNAALALAKRQVEGVCARGARGRTAAPAKGVVELGNAKAAAEMEALVTEIFGEQLSQKLAVGA